MCVHNDAATRAAWLGKIAESWTGTPYAHRRHYILLETAKIGPEGWTSKKTLETRQNSSIVAKSDEEGTIYAQMTLGVVFNDHLDEQGRRVGFEMWVWLDGTGFKGAETPYVTILKRMVTAGDTRHYSVIFREEALPLLKKWL